MLSTTNQLLFMSTIDHNVRTRHLEMVIKINGLPHLEELLWMSNYSYVFRGNRYPVCHIVSDLLLILWMCRVTESIILKATYCRVQHLVNI